MNNIPFTERPDFPQLLDRADLSLADKDMARQFAEDGYIIFDPEIPMCLPDRIIDSLQVPFSKEVGANRRLFNAWEYNKYVQSLAAWPSILQKVQMLYRRRPIPFQTLNFAEGTEQATHSDMIHFNSLPERFMCGCWVALEDVTVDNGPLHYYPGSHKLPFYDLLAMGVKATKDIGKKRATMVYIEQYEPFIRQLVESINLPKKTLTIKKGQAMIWSANLLHGGEKINDIGATRYSQVTHYFFENCAYYTPRLSDVGINKVYMNDLVDISTGRKVFSTYFGKRVRSSNSIYLQQQGKQVVHALEKMLPEVIVNRLKKLIR